MRQSPIKRSKHIFKLSKEHHFTLLFSWKIRWGLKNKVEIERIRNYVRYFWNHDMRSHFKEEEEILFAPGTNDKVRRAIEEHQLIKEKINKLLVTVDGNEVSQQLASLADTIDAHVRYEERELFPHLEQVLTEAQLEEIGQQLEKNAVVHDVYEDEFWIKPNDSKIDER